MSEYVEIDMDSLALEPEFQSGLTRWYTGIYMWMMAGMATTALSAWFLTESGIIFTVMSMQFGFMGVLFAKLGLVWFVGSRLETLSLAVVRATFFTYSAMLGFVFSLVLLTTSMEDLMTAFGVTVGTFGSMALYGGITKKNLSAWGSFGMMGAIGMFIAGIINMFLGSSMISFMMSVVGVIAFSALTAYDMRKLREQFAVGFVSGTDMRKYSVYGALNLYIEFVNLFLSILRLIRR